jgi:hypothetical protein
MVKIRKLLTPLEIDSGGHSCEGLANGIAVHKHFLLGGGGGHRNIERRDAASVLGHH